MKKIIISVIMLTALFSLYCKEINDQLWLKAVQLKRNAKNYYSSKTTFQTIQKDKRGNEKEKSVVTLKYIEQDGNIITKFVEGYQDGKALTSDDKMVESYMQTPANIDDGQGFFFTRTSDSFKLKRKGSEVINGDNYIKFWIELEKEEDGEEIDIEGYIWINEETGVPLKSVLELDPHKIMVKKITMTNRYKLVDQDKLCIYDTSLDIVASMVLKKFYITQRSSHSDFKLLGQ